MELDIDFSIKSKYGDYHSFYSQNLKIFKRFLRIFENFFKKEKYLNSEIKVDEDAKNKATIRFCSEKYQMALQVNPACLDSASLLFSRCNGDRLSPIGEIMVDAAGNIVFPGNQVICPRDDYEFNNAVLKSFFVFMTVTQDGRSGAR